jgi:hypothetical protein
MDPTSRIAMTEVILDKAQVVTMVGEYKSAQMTKHIPVNDRPATRGLHRFAKDRCRLETGSRRSSVQDQSRF